VGDLLYLEVEDVLGLYAEIFRCSVDEARAQLRNAPGLEGALTRPKTRAHYEQADIASQAAALAHGIAETQPFIDGNKRTALAAILTFIAVNGYELRTSQEERADWILRLSAGMDIDGLADAIRQDLLVAGPE
jgi:death-on-curing protein